MAQHRVSLLPSERSIEVPTGTLLIEAMQLAGEELAQPCGGQGRCGRCAVQVEGSGLRRRSTLRLSTEDLEAGFALACQSVVEGDLQITVPPQERVRRMLVTDRVAARPEVPLAYDPETMQSLRILQLALPAPSLHDNRDDQARLLAGLADAGHSLPLLPLSVLRRLGSVLRDSDWKPWVVLDQPVEGSPGRLVDVLAHRPKPLGLAVDIGTTTVTVFLVHLETGEVLAHAAEYNDQIARGEDVVSRIISAGKPGGLEELGGLVRQTIHGLLDQIRLRTGIALTEILKVTIAGNTTMSHLFLGVPPASIRLTPYIPAVNHPPSYLAGELGLQVHPLAGVDVLPGVASYVGADITAGALAAGMAQADQLTLFIDVGTNGEIVLGTRDWLVACACSAGPAFEGAGVVDGMRATEGAIEEVWVHASTLEPTLRVIGGGRPRGLCGSGLLSLLAELFVTGVIDRGGNFKTDLGSPRVRIGEHGPEYVLAWPSESATGRAVSLTKVDVDNLMRAKAAIYAGYSVLASNVGVDLADVQQVLIGGAFGKYLNVEKAVQIGLLPDVAWDRFRFLGNTAIRGAHMALLSRQARQTIADLASRMTYVELSADNTFYDAFTASLFLPHTDIRRFPSVEEVWDRHNGKPAPVSE
ncbi:MAG TPA: ASKHA domain-containing protein [Anaerolineales bacterium]|nr:ASKHA domain-containing protein [Anaerolineales bacterium]